MNNIQTPKNITSITPISKNFKISWDIELACNYDCSYCFPNRHTYVQSEKLSLKTATELKEYWKILYNAIVEVDPFRKIEVRLGGGEPTLNKNLIELIQNIQGYENVINIGVATNGSASTSFYLQLIPHLTSLSISLHSEFFNEKRLFNTIRKCVRHPRIQSQECLLHIFIMNEPNERIKLYENFCIEHNIYYTIQNIVSKLPIRLNPPKHKTLYNFNQ